MRDQELKRINILKASIMLENARQIQKWGIQDRSSFEWMLFLTEEFGELAQAIAEYEYRAGDPDDVYDEAIQVATLALKIAEMTRCV